MSAQFKNASAKQFAVLMIAGTAASGIMIAQSIRPIASLFRNSSGAAVEKTARILPLGTAGLVAGDSSVKGDTASLITVLNSQVANLVNRVTSVEEKTQQNLVLGDSTEEEISLPVREEFPPAVNLLRNSSFEEASDNAPRQWQYQYDSNSGNSFTSAEAIRTGTLGLKIKGSGTGNFGLSQPAAKAIERRAYALSLWVKPVNTDAHTVKLSFWDEVSNKEAASKTFNFSGTKEWSRIVFQIDNRNSWNGKKWFPMITVNGLSSGTLYMDDAQLEEANSYTPYHFAGGGAAQSHVSVLGDGSVEIDAHGNIYPAVSGIGGLGTGSNKFQELRLSKATIDKEGSLSLQGGLTVDGNTTLSGAINLSGTIKSNLIPDADNAYDLGSSAKEWRDLYIDGIGYIDTISLLNDETIDNATNGDIVFTDSGTSNALTFDLNNAADTIAITNTEDLDIGSSADGADALYLYSSAGGIDIMATGAAAGEDIDIAATGSSVNLSSTEDAVDSITLRSAKGGIDLSSSNAGGNGNLTLRSAGTLLLDTSSTNSQLLANVGTFALNTLAGDAVVTVQASNADTEDFILRVSENATASTANGRDIFLAAVDDMILYMDNLAVTASNGVNYEVNGAKDFVLRVGDGAREVVADGNDIQLSAYQDMLLDAQRFFLTTSSGDALFEIDSDYDYIVRAGDGAAEVVASANDIQLSAEDQLYLHAAASTLATSNGDQVFEANGDQDFIVRAGDAAREVAANNNDIQLAAEADVLIDGATFTLSTSNDAVGSLALNASRGGISISSSNAGGNGNLTLRSAGTLLLDTSSTNSQLLANVGTFALNTLAGDAVVTVQASNADTEDFILRVSENATASTANGRDIFLAAVDDLILFGDNYTLTATNGVNYNVSGADMALEINGDNDYVLRAGDAAAESTADNNDIFLAAEADLLLNGATFTLATSNGDQVFEANGDQDFIVRAGDAAREVAANNNDIQLAAEADVLIDGATFTLSTSNDAVGSLALNASRGGISISSSNAGGNGNIAIKSAGTLSLETSATNSNIMLRAGTGRIDVSGNTIVINSGAGTLNLSSNSAITIASSTTASIYGATDTLIGRPGTVTRVDGRLCIEGSGDGSACPAGSDGRLFVNTTGEAVDDAGDVYDLAEYYPASEAVDPGTVVVADNAARATVKMSRYPYQRVLGVVSSTPAIMIDQGWFGIGNSTLTARDAMKPLVALVGRVPVKVTNENGAIQIGDRLVTSAKPGYAMKAVKQGLTLGMALEDFDAAEGKVMTFVNISWYHPEVIDALEAEYATAQALGVEPDPLAATTQALTGEMIASDGVPAVLGITAESPLADAAGETAAAAADVNPQIIVDAKPKEFLSIAVAQTAAVGELTVEKKAAFAGEITVMADATFQKSVIIVGDIKIGGNLELAGAVSIPMTAKAEVSAGDPLVVNGDGTVSKAGGSRPLIGVAVTSAAAGGQVKVAVAGRVKGLTGLAAGQRYYVNEAGALTASAENNQALGVAISETELLVQVAPAASLTITAQPTSAPEPTSAPVIINLEPTTTPLTPQPTLVPTAAPTETPLEIAATPAPVQ